VLHQSDKIAGNAVLSALRALTSQPVSEVDMAKNNRITIGAKYGRLTVIALPDVKIDGRYQVVCRCDCGKEHVAVEKNVRTGNTRSCGCLKSDGKHGHAKHFGLRSREHKAWTAMRFRCSSPKSINYKNYGGRGIKVCDRWESFEKFLEDMGECPTGMTLERIDNDLDYGPSNCRWATMKEQAKNRRTNVFIEHDGRRMILNDWAKELGMHPSSITLRMRKGLPTAAVLAPKVRRNVANPNS